MKDGESKPDMHFTVTCGGAPLAIEGEIGDQKLYYRSRHGSWRIELDDKTIAVGKDEIRDSQQITEALRLIGHHCFRPIWDYVTAREDKMYEQH